MASKIKFPYGRSNFGLLVKDGYHFVDKTPYIEVLENLDESFITFLRPRRFGKSLFVSMLQHYYGAEYEAEFDVLFGQYYIGQHPTPKKNGYWILKFNFSGINTTTIEKTKEGFLINVRDGVKKLIEQYLDLNKEETQFILKQKEANTMLRALFSTMSNKKYLPIYLLIDEYDHFTNELMAFDFPSFQEFVSTNGFVRKFYEVIKNGADEALIHRLFITGVSPITLDSLTSGFNIGKHFSLRQDLNEMMGFTETEVLSLLKHVVPTKQIPTVLEDLRLWYNGYLFNRKGKDRIYNSDMVLYFLSEYRATNAYPDQMLDTNISSDYSKLRRLFSLKTPLKNYEILKEIVEKKPQKAEIISEFSFNRAFTKNDFLSLLFYLGFLTIKGGRSRLVDLYVPNHVIQQLYFDFFVARLTQREEIPSQLDHLQQAMIEMAYEGNPRPFFQVIANVLEHLSRRDYQKFEEKHIKAILIALASQVDLFFIKSERENKAGYSDILFLERPPFVIDHQYIFELKYVKKENQKSVPSVQQKAKEQLQHYLSTDEELKTMKALQAWTVVIVKDKVITERVN